MRKLMIGVPFILLFGANIASAADNQYQGNFCQPRTPTDAAQVAYGQNGVFNFSSSTDATVECGTAPVTSTTVNLVSLLVYDRSSTEDVCCTVALQNTDGGGGNIATKQLCSSGVSTSGQLLSWSPPALASGPVWIECTLPATTSIGQSHVASYRIQSTP